jgi:hypothetical protein
LPVFHSLLGAETAFPGADTRAASVLRLAGYVFDPELRGYTVNPATIHAAKARNLAIAALAAQGKPVTHRLHQPNHDGEGQHRGDAATGFTRHVSAVAVQLDTLDPGPDGVWSCTIEHNPSRSTRTALAGSVWGPPEVHGVLQDPRLPRLAVLQRGDDERHLLLAEPGTDGRTPTRATPLAPARLDVDAPCTESLILPQMALPSDPGLAADRIMHVLRPELHDAVTAFERAAASRGRLDAPQVIFRPDATFGPLAVTITDDPSPPRIHRVLDACGFELVGDGIYAHHDAPGPGTARKAIQDLRAAGIPVSDELGHQRGERAPGMAPWATAPAPSLDGRPATTLTAAQAPRR